MLHSGCSKRQAPNIKAITIGLSTVVVLFADVSHANDDVTTNVLNQDAKAKLAYCQQCHGPGAQGFHGYIPIPRLAGQQIEYLKNQLQAFADRRRRNRIMFNVARVLSPEMISTLAINLHDLSPAPLAEGREGELA